MQANNGITGTIAAAAVSVAVVSIFRYENIVVGGVVIVASMLVSVYNDAVAVYRNHDRRTNPNTPANSNDPAGHHLPWLPIGSACDLRPGTCQVQRDHHPDGPFRPTSCRSQGLASVSSAAVVQQHGVGRHVGTHHHGRQQHGATVPGAGKTRPKLAHDAGECASGGAGRTGGLGLMFFATPAVSLSLRTAAGSRRPAPS